MSQYCRHFRVTGRVQGVFFRSETRRKATELSLTGWVKNLADGNVELIACGEPENLKKLESWLWQGPPAAEVTDVIGEDCLLTVHAQFEIK
jgi:acylphosphatase